MSKAILSHRYPQFVTALQKLGYETIPTERVERFIPYEQEHADMQCLLLDDTAFVLKCCEDLANALRSRCNVVLCADDIGHDYPRNVALNAAIAGKNVICRTDTLDSTVKAYCEAHGYRLLHVRQGYAGCSCSVVGENAIITADQGIYKAVKDSLDVLLIGQGRVRLEGASCGFIGGASGYDPSKRTLYFCGNIQTHPDTEKIVAFCEKHRVKVHSLTDGELIDVGGIKFIV